MSAAEAQQPAYWQALAQQLNQVRGAVLLQPRRAVAAAGQYRRLWRQLCRQLRQEQVVNVVWV